MAAPTLTPRLKLTTDPDGESLVSNNYDNWNKVDLAAGVQHINSGQAIPLPYENALIAEKDTGKVYTLTTDGAGGWNKRYVIYPYLYSAYTVRNLMPNSTTYNMWGWDSFGTGSTVNSSDADRGAGNTWKVPIKGLYDISVTARWDGGDVDKLLCATLSINGTEYVWTENRMQSLTPPYASTLMIQHTLPLSAGDLVCHLYQNHAGDNQLALATSIFVSMVRPLS